MKTYIFTLFTLIVSGGNAFSQCPPSPPQKIASPVCAKPSNIKVTSLSCTELQVQWNGNSDQTYEIAAKVHGPATDLVNAIIVSDFSCDAAGTCKAIIPVVEGTKVIWGVQSICFFDNRNYYSYQLRDKEVAIPSCKSASENFSQSITNVYPNPTTGIISVEYLSNSAGKVQFSIYDVNGKVAFSKMEKAEQGVSATYEFHLTDLTPGIYLLEARSGLEVSSKKFVLLR